MSDVGGFGGGSGDGGGGGGDARGSQETCQSSQQQQQQQQQEQVMTVKLDIEARQSSDLLMRLQPLLSQQGSTGGSADEGGVELNLGLSLGSGSPLRKASKGGEFSQHQQQQQQKAEFLRGWSSEDNVVDEQSQGQNQQQVLLRQPRHATAATVQQQQQQQQQQQDAGREHAAKLQRRQEARKKRRILIDECRRSAGPPRPGLGPHRRCRPPASPPPRLPPVDDLRPPLEPDSAEDAELRSALRAERDRARSSAAAAGRVKLENVEASPESCKVIRPSPIHESKEWVQKFLEMQKTSRSSEPSTSYDADEESKSRPSSSLESPPFPGFDLIQKSPDSCSKRKRLSPSSQDCSRPSLAPNSLFRSTSLGSSFASFKSDPPTQQQPSSVITRTDSSAGGLFRTLSEGSKLEREISFGSPAATQQEQQQRPNVPKLSAFKSPKKEPVDEDPGTSKPRTSIKRSNSVCFGIAGQAAAVQAAAAQAAPADRAGMSRQLPLVSTTGTGPNGKTVSGVLFAYRKGDVKIICACHGRHMTAREFVEHAGGVNVTHPEKCIVVNPSMLTRSRSMINSISSTTAPPASS